MSETHDTNAGMVTGTQFAPGEVLLGRFRIERVLGAGGMGVVVAARHLDLDTLVAIKFLHPEMAGNPDLAARFTREARAAARITSEHVCRVMDVGVLPTGAQYMVMEYLDGCDLAAFVRDKGPLGISLAVRYVLQAGEAIAEAHAAGVIHRDLKPGNLFLARRPDGREIIKVLDFGISKIYDTAGSGPQRAVTQTSAVLGSPVYMSPEQLTNSRDVDARADLWSLGVVLFELITARQPFSGESIPQVCVAILHGEPLSLGQVRPDVPDGLVRVVSRCLRKSRDERYHSVGELAEELARFGGPEAEASAERIGRFLHRQMGSRGQAAEPGQTAVLPGGGQGQGPHRVVATAVLQEAPSRPGIIPRDGLDLKPKPAGMRRWALVGGVTVALGGLGTYWVLHRRSSESGSTAATEDRRAEATVRETTALRRATAVPVVQEPESLPPPAPAAPAAAPPESATSEHHPPSVAPKPRGKTAARAGGSLRGPRSDSPVAPAAEMARPAGPSSPPRPSAGRDLEWETERR